MFRKEKKEYGSSNDYQPIRVSHSRIQDNSLHKTKRALITFKPIAVKKKEGLQGYQSCKKNWAKWVPGPLGIAEYCKGSIKWDGSQIVLKEEHI